MATNPMTQSVLLFAHHQTTTPFMPHRTVSAQAQVAKPVEEKDPKEEEEEQEDGEEEEDEETEETEEEKNG